MIQSLLTGVRFNRNLWSPNPYFICWHLHPNKHPVVAVVASEQALCLHACIMGILREYMCACVSVYLKKFVFYKFMCGERQRGLLVSLTQQGCHQRSLLFHFHPASCFSALSFYGSKDSMRALIQSWRDAVGENSGSQVGTITPLILIRGSITMPLQFRFGLQQTVHFTHSPAELDH